MTNVSVTLMFSFYNSQDTANINDAQASTESNAKNSTISTSSTSISTSSLISTTTSTGTTLPPENHELNFSAVWQTDEDSLVDFITVLWSEESNVNATRPVNWKLLVSRESENESLIIRSSCSWHNNSRHHQVKLEKEAPNYRVSCNDNSRHEGLLSIRSCLSYDLLLFAHPDEDHPIGRTKLKPLIKCWLEIDLDLHIYLMLQLNIVLMKRIGSVKFQGHPRLNRLTMQSIKR